METYCINPYCSQPVNLIPELEPESVDRKKLCMTCGEPLLLRERYLPLKPLGKGGFGATFLACDVESPNQKLCVIKRLQPPNDLKPEQVEKVKIAFFREAQVLESLGENNLNIPTLYDYFKVPLSSQNLPYPNAPQELNVLVQQYIDGEDLHKALHRKGRFSESELQEILKQVLPVLKFIHSRDVVHRDIKPENIIRDRQGKLYLIDFGAVKQVVSGVSIERSLVFLTPAFAPPEQVFGKPVDSSADFYALAATCMYLLTGEDATTLRDNLMQWHWRSKVQVSQKFADILDKMLSPEPRYRFQSADEIIQLLNQPMPVTVVQPEAQPGVPRSSARRVKNLKQLTVGVGGSLAIVGLILISRFVGVNFLEKPPIIDENILTYKSFAHGFQVQYPESWDIEEPAGGQYTGIVLEITPRDAISPAPGVSISIEELVVPESLEDYTTSVLDGIKNLGGEILTSGKTQLDQTEAYQVVYLEKDWGNNVQLQSWRIWTLKEQKAYLLTYTVEADQFDQFHKLMEKVIVSSFKLP